MSGPPSAMKTTTNIARKAFASTTRAAEEFGGWASGAAYNAGVTALDIGAAVEGQCTGDRGCCVPTMRDAIGMGEEAICAAASCVGRKCARGSAAAAPAAGAGAANIGVARAATGAPASVPRVDENDSGFRRWLNAHFMRLSSSSERYSPLQFIHPAPTYPEAQVLTEYWRLANWGALESINRNSKLTKIYSDHLNNRTERDLLHVYNLIRPGTGSSILDLPVLLERRGGGARRKNKSRHRNKNKNRNRKTRRH